MAQKDQFDPNIPNYMQGEVGDVVITSPAGFPPPALPNRVIDPTKPFTLDVSWNMFGALVPLWMAALGGSWQVTVYAESLGAGPEKFLATTSVPVGTFAADPDPAHVNGRVYSAQVLVPAGALVEGNPPPSDVSGTYRLSMTIFLNSNLGTPGFDLIGFSDGPLIQAENPV